MEELLTLKEIIEKYELPIKVKKRSWFGDFYFLIIQKPFADRVPGNRYKDGEYYDHINYSYDEKFMLYGDENRRKAEDTFKLPFDDREEADSHAEGKNTENSSKNIFRTIFKIHYNKDENLKYKVYINYNNLDPNEDNYVAGITVLYVVENNTDIKKGIFQGFDRKNGQKIIYLSIDGDVKFYYFPNTEYVFTGMDDAIKYLSNHNKSNANVSVRQIIEAYKKFPYATEPAEDYDEALEEEKEYHKTVDDELKAEIDYNVRLRDNADDIIAEVNDSYLREMKKNYEDERNFRDEHLIITTKRKNEAYRRGFEETEKNISELNQKKRKPYFARMDCGANKYDLHTAYIGESDIPGYVTDWRNAEVGNVYYNSDILKNSENLVIALKRQIDIEAGVLNSFTDTINLYSGMDSDSSELDANSDSMLIKLLEESRKNKRVHDIIKSIQAEQYRIITSNFDSNIVVNGCAGSGKTMIMYHRLSYIAYNYELQTQNVFKPETVYVITPSELFDSLNVALIKELKLDQVNNAPLSGHINGFISGALQNQGLLPSVFTIQNSLGGYVSHSELENYYKTLNTIYDNLDSDALSDTRFCMWLFKNINILLEENGFEPIDFYEFGDDASWVTDVFNSDKYYRNEVFARLEPLYKNNLKEMFSRISYNNIIESLEDTKDTSQKNAERTLKVKKYEVLLKGCLGKVTERDAKTGGVSSNVHGFWNLFDLTGLFEKALTLIYIEKYLTALLKGEINSLEILRVDYLIDKCFGIIPNYERDLILLRWLTEHFDSASDLFDASLVFIDEYQNYSPFELNCILKLFGKNKPAYNLYGDFDQQLSSDGIENIGKINDYIQNPEIYPISINYRNAKTITEYINKRTGKSMQSIGVEGIVDETTESECVFELIDRTAVITKDVKKACELLSKSVNKELINDVAANSVIKENAINVMSVEDCKGLEFDNVYVIEEGMNNNELYVSLTRALSYLTVIQNNISE